MTPEESGIIKFHANMALWCAINSHAFNDYCMSLSSTKKGIKDICYSFFHSKMNHEMFICQLKYISPDSQVCRLKYNHDYITDYYNFCKSRLVEEDDFSYSDEVLDQKKTDEWYDYFDKPAIDQQLFSSLFNEDPIIVLKDTFPKIEQATVLSSCDELKKQQILLDALVSLLFHIILQDNDFERQSKCCKLLQDTLIDWNENKYSTSSRLFSTLTHLSPSVCESFFKGFGMNIREYDSLLSYLDRGNEDGAIHEIATLRNRNMLGNNSVLFEYCVDFQKARIDNIYIDWFRRFTFKSDIQSINAALLKTIKDEQLMTQDIINTLLSGFCLNKDDFEAIKLPANKKGGNGDPKPKEKRYITSSMRHVDKERLINMLIDNGWVSVHPDRDEVVRRLNYFFNDKSSVMPSDPKFTVTWCKEPKNQLVCLLIRMLLTKTWGFNPEDVVVGQVDDKQKGKRFYPGINSKVIDPLSNFEKVWEIVNNVFQVSNAAVGTFNSRYKNPSKHLNKLVELAKDILSCRKEK